MKLLELGKLFAVSISSHLPKQYHFQEECKSENPVCSLLVDRKLKKGEYIMDTWAKEFEL